MSSSRLFIILLLIAASFSTSIGQDWECKDCPKRKIGLFDLDVWIKNPEQTPSSITYSQWIDMFMVAGGIQNTLFHDDPSKECLEFYDGQMAVLAGMDEQNYQHGSTSTSLPPAAGITDAVDYWISGIIAFQESDGIATIKAFVQASGTGETVVEVSQAYDFAISGSENGKNIATSLMPLMGKIRSFEKKKRDEDDQVVIDPAGKGATIELKPDKETIKAGETTEVTIKLLDCDGVPIKNMEVTLTPKGGSFDPEKITTDDSGEAKTKFTANCDPGKFMQVLEFEYRLPFSFDLYKSGGDKDIEIESADKFELIYKHSLTQEYGGQFKLSSNGSGSIPCTIDWSAEPPTINGSGTVNASWTGNAEQCKFVGNSAFSLTYKGSVIYGETGTALIKLVKSADNALGGEFKIICGTITQTVPESMPIPAIEEDRVLIFEFKDGATEQLNVPDSNTNYSYSIKLKCK